MARRLNWEKATLRERVRRDLVHCAAAAEREALNG